MSRTRSFEFGEASACVRAYEAAGLHTTPCRGNLNFAANSARVKTTEGKLLSSRQFSSLDLELCREPNSEIRPLGRPAVRYVAWKLHQITPRRFDSGEIFSVELIFPRKVFEAKDREPGSAAFESTFSILTPLAF